jgi:G3E family GTPase
LVKSLIAVLGAGKGTWGHVNRLISEENFDKIVLISNEWGQQNFSASKPAEWVMVNNRSGFEVIKKSIMEKLPSGDLCVSLISGSGKEHMAVIAALKEAKRDYKLVILTGEGTKYY